MQNRKIKKIKAYRFLLLMVMALILWGAISQNGRIGTFAESIQDLQEQKEQAEKEAKELESAKKELEASLGDMDSELYQLSEEINGLSDHIEQIENEIALREEEILALEKDAKVQYDSMKLRIQYLYENGGTFSWTSIFSAESFVEALNRAEYALDLATTDRRLLEEYKNTLFAIQTETQELESQKTELLASREAFDQQKSALLGAIDVAKEDITNTNQLIADKETDVIEYEEQIAAMEAYERKLEEEKAKKAAEEQARLKAEEEARKKAEEEKKKEEERRKAEEEAKKKEEEEAKKQENEESNQSDNTTDLIEETETSEEESTDSPEGYWLHTTTPVTLSEEEAELFAALVYCEAGGESYETQFAVASVVVNRINSSKYPDNLIDVIYQKSQFSPAASGRLTVVLEKGYTTDSCRKAVQEAITGNICGDWLHFCYNFGTIDGDVIGSEVFY